MKFLPAFFVAVFVTIAFPLFAGNEKDTTVIIRARYAGLDLTYRNTFRPQEAFYKSDLHPELNMQQVMSVRDGQLFGVNAFFTTPFLQKWNAELGIGLSSHYREVLNGKVTAIDTTTDPATVVAYSSDLAKEYVTLFNLRGGFARELFRSSQVALTAAVNGWVTTSRIAQPGYCGADAGVDLYYQAAPRMAFRLRLAAGYMKAGGYYTAGIAICRQGKKTMRAHPDHYYIRTYDNGE